MSYYDEYAAVHLEIESLEQKKNELRGLILKEMVDDGEKTVETAIGKFTVAKLKSWTYSPKISALEERIKPAIAELNGQLKAAKAKEESTGDATCVEENSLRFIQIKL